MDASRKKDVRDEHFFRIRNFQYLIDKIDSVYTKKGKDTTNSKI